VTALAIGLAVGAVAALATVAWLAYAARTTRRRPVGRPPAPDDLVRTVAEMQTAYLAAADARIHTYRPAGRRRP
jgi:hypothetical protein